MKIRFYNGLLLTMENDLSVCEGEVWTDMDEITFAGKPETFADISFDREINLKGDLIMPGFKNAHTHSPMTFARSYADGLPLQEWLTQKIFPIENKLTPENIYHFTKIALMEYIASGTTTVFDMYFDPMASVNAAVEYGFRYAVCGASVELSEKYYDKLNNFSPLISMNLGFHAEYTNPIEKLTLMAQLAEEKKAPVYAHNSETQKEVQGCLARYGKTPTALFEELGIYKYGGGGFHCVYLSEQDINIMKRHKIYAVANPSSNLKLASGISEVVRLSKSSVPLALGTDGAASNNALSMWREMYLYSTLQKYLLSDAAAMPAEDALYAAVRGGAGAMNLKNCDCLAVGQKADLIVINLNKPNMQPINNITNNLVYSGSESNVRLTMIAGKILYENGEFFLPDEPGLVYEKANKLLKTLID